MQAPSALAAVLAAAAAAGCASTRDTLPPIPPFVDRAHLHFNDPAVRPGQQAPDFSLLALSGDAVTSLSSLRGRPVVLVFGSYT